MKEQRPNQANQKKANMKLTNEAEKKKQYSQPRRKAIELHLPPGRVPPNQKRTTPTIAFQQLQQQQQQQQQRTPRPRRLSASVRPPEFNRDRPPWPQVVVPWASAFRGDVVLRCVT